MRPLRERYLTRPILGFVLCLIVSSAWSGTPTTFRISKDFRSLIAQNERPEIVACMTATRLYIKKTPTYEDLRWLDTTSKTALLNETEINGQLTRTIILQAQVLFNSTAIFESWKPVFVQCKQMDEGNPVVTIKSVQAVASDVDGASGAGTTKEDGKK